MTRALKVAVIDFPQRYEWRSLNTILPALRRSWKLASRAGRIVTCHRISGKSPLRLVPKLLDADWIVIPDYAILWRTHCELIELLRGRFNLKAPFVFQLHGDGTQAGWTFRRIQHLLRTDDLFIASCEADRRAFLQCYPRARVEVVPFPLAGKTGRRRKTKPAAALPVLVYSGRVSEQKNLHGLLLALSFLRKDRRFEAVTLEIYGKPDRLGSPNMGLKPIDYGRFLKSLVRQLGLSRNVRWRGSFEPARLARHLAKTPHILVSASLHADENFGVAAFESLAAGSHAVLTAWGGHRDLARNFAGLAATVRVQGSPAGPFVDPVELAAALKSKLLSSEGAPVSPRALEPYTVEAVARRFAALTSHPRRPPGRALRPSRLIMNRKKTRSVFTGYDDPVALALFRAYGMLRPRKRKGRVPCSTLFIVPWVRVTSASIVVADPHRGRFSLARRQGAKGPALSQSELGWLYERGWAFELKSSS